MKLEHLQKYNFENLKLYGDFGEFGNGVVEFKGVELENNPHDKNKRICVARSFSPEIKEVLISDIANYKLILKPLSAISKIHTDTMQEDLLIDNPDTIALIQTITQPLAAKNGINNRLPNSVFCWLLERGYDIYGFIASGDAVSIHSL